MTGKRYTGKKGEPAPPKRIDHVGIVVKDLRSARRFLSDVLGFELQREAHIPGRLDAAFFKCGDAAIELIEIIDPDERARRLGESTARIEHIALEVTDLEQTVEWLSAQGVETTSSVPAIVGPIRSQVTRSDTTEGITFQIFDRRIGTVEPGPA